MISIGIVKIVTKGIGIILGLKSLITPIPTTFFVFIIVILGMTSVLVTVLHFVMVNSTPVLDSSTVAVCMLRKGF